MFPLQVFQLAFLIVEGAQSARGLNFRLRRRQSRASPFFELAAPESARAALPQIEQGLSEQAWQSVAVSVLRQVAAPVLQQVAVPVWNWVGKGAWELARQLAEVRAGVLCEVSRVLSVRDLPPAPFRQNSLQASGLSIAWPELR